MKDFARKHKPLLGTAGVALIAILLLPTRASAVLGLGDIVFDPAAFAKMVQEYSQQLQQYARQGLQLEQEAQTAANTLTHLRLAVQQAQYFGTKQFWQAVSKQLWRDQANNLLGETAQWNIAINGATPAAPGAWTNATTALGNGTWLLGQVPGTSPNVSDLATVEIADTTSVNTLRTLADFRNEQNQNEAALQKLESDALDEDAESNVQVRQLNLAAAGTVQMLRNQQNVIDVLGYQLEQQLIMNKPMRDAMAATLSRYADMYAYQQNEPTAMASPQATFAGYQIP